MSKILTKQLSINSLFELSYIDAIITSSGYESRATYFAANFQVPCKKKIAFAFNDHTNETSRLINDKKYCDLGFEIVIQDGDSFEYIQKFLDDLLNDSKDIYNIVIDYSCMTRVWYAAILNYFSLFQDKYNKVNLYFSYSPAEYTPSPKESVLNKYVGPIEGFSSLSIPQLPTALIIGLGYIPERAFGLAEYLDVSPYIFYGDETYNSEYYSAVVKNNAELLKSVKNEKFIKYPVNEPFVTENQLLDLCASLIDNFRIIIAPCGPKIFTLISLIVSLKINEIDVWRISAGKYTIPSDKKAKGDFLIYQVQFKKQT